MSLGDSSSHRQAKTRARAFLGIAATKEAIEHSIQILRAKPIAIVKYRDGA